MGAPFPSTYKQVVENMKRINEIVSNYVQHLVDTIFNPTAWSDGSTDVKFDPTDNKLKVIGTTIASDNPSVQSGPSEYFRNITWETKLSSAMGLSGLPNVGEYVTVMTVAVPDHPIWQVAYSDEHMATYYRQANDDLATWSDWESVGRKQFIQSDAQPERSVQDIGDYWHDHSANAAIVAVSHRDVIQDKPTLFTVSVVASNGGQSLLVTLRIQSEYAGSVNVYATGYTAQGQSTATSAVQTASNLTDASLELTLTGSNVHNTKSCKIFVTNVSMIPLCDSFTVPVDQSIDRIWVKTTDGTYDAVNPITHVDAVMYGAGDATLHEKLNAMDEAIEQAGGDLSVHNTDPTAHPNLYICAGQKSGTTLGANATAEGINTTASGEHAHAEGGLTEATGFNSHAEGEQTVASGGFSHAEGALTTASGGYSHAEGSSTVAGGDSSHAEGSSTTASGKCSHAEGEGTQASAESSHAEGFGTTASERFSHAEGINTTASGTESHAEGHNTIASGNSSHAEGGHSKATGYMSHAEGSETEASGENSHTEGSYTRAQRRSQHVFGECNILDTEGSSTSDRGKFVEIVGNGRNAGALSNARTLDWSGNETLAGKLTVGAAPTSDMDVATKQYTDSSISAVSTEIKQYADSDVDALRDETDTNITNALNTSKQYTDNTVTNLRNEVINGTIGGAVFYGTTPPSNTRALWIDTTPSTGGLKYHNGTAWVSVPVAYVEE